MLEKQSGGGSVKQTFNFEEEDNFGINTSAAPIKEDESPSKGRGRPPGVARAAAKGNAMHLSDDREDDDDMEEEVEY